VVKYKVRSGGVDGFVEFWKRVRCCLSLSLALEAWLNGSKYCYIHSSRCKENK
jgi:hypothetical protein